MDEWIYGMDHRIKIELITKYNNVQDVLIPTECKIASIHTVVKNKDRYQQDQ